MGIPFLTSLRDLVHSAPTLYQERQHHSIINTLHTVTPTLSWSAEIGDKRGTVHDYFLVFSPFTVKAWNAQHGYTTNATYTCGRHTLKPTLPMKRSKVGRGTSHLARAIGRSNPSKTVAGQHLNAAMRQDAPKRFLLYITFTPFSIIPFEMSAHHHCMLQAQGASFPIIRMFY